MGVPPIPAPKYRDFTPTLDLALDAVDDTSYRSCCLVKSAHHSTLTAHDPFAAVTVLHDGFWPLFRHDFRYDRPDFRYRLR